MERSHFHVVVIGAGPGGLAAAERCGELSLTTACIDDRPLVGGTCLNVGCIPSKTLLHCTSLHGKFNKAQALGLYGEVHIDFAAMMHNKEEVITALGTGAQGLLEKHGVKLLRGKARFIDPHTLSVQDQDGNRHELTCDNVIIATGSEPIPLPFAPFDEQLVLSSTGILSLPWVPRALCVVGAGAIGLELASVLRCLGSEVTVLEMLDEICPGQDASLRKALRQSLERQGLTFHLGARLTSVTKSEEGLSIQFSGHTGKEERMDADVLLVSVGRRPFTSGLALEAAGLAPDAKGFLEVDEFFRVNKQPHIYAIGDVIAGAGLAHRASEEGYAVAQLLANKGAKVNYLSVPNVVYTVPEVAAVGLTEEEARKRSLDFVVGVAHFRANARARCYHATEGFLKIIAARHSGHILGIHILGEYASELIATAALAVAAALRLDDLAAIPFAHPTFSEAFKEAARHALR